MARRPGACNIENKEKHTEAVHNAHVMKVTRTKRPTAGETSEASHAVEPSAGGGVSRLAVRRRLRLVVTRLPAENWPRGILAQSNQCQ